MSSRYDDEKWTPEEFLEKMDSEGGVVGMLMWGGPGCFPPDLREDAETIATCVSRMEKKFGEWGY